MAKIEDQSAVRQIDEMIETADVVMIARGDLGIECPMEELPIIQRKIVKRCLRIGKPVIVATHMLESMIENPVPTRAEITDVANAVFEQADAIMLSGETIDGPVPGGMREGLRSRGAANRAKRRGRLRQRRGPGRHAAENGGLGGLPGEFTAAREARGLHPSWHDGALRFQFAAGECADLCLHFERSGLSPNRPLLGHSPDHARFCDDPKATIESAITYLRNARLAEPGDNLIVLSDMRGRRR